MTRPSHNFGIRLVTLALLAGSVGVVGCQLGDPIVRFQITVDSITVTPAQIEDGSKLQATFHGLIGPDKCWMFTHAEPIRTADYYEVRIFGQHVVRDDCPQAESRLAFITDILQPINDPFRITAIQPDGSKLNRIMTH